MRRSAVYGLCFAAASLTLSLLVEFRWPTFAEVGWWIVYFAEAAGLFALIASLRNWLFRGSIAESELAEKQGVVDDPRRSSFAKNFARQFGYDRQGAYAFFVGVAYIAACAGVIWLFAWVASQLRH